MWKHIGLSEIKIKEYSVNDGTLGVHLDAVIRVAELELAHLRDVEHKRQGLTPVCGKDIEELRAAILREVNRRAQLPCDIAYIEDRFSTEHRRSLYALLGDLEEGIPRRFPWQAVYDAVNAYRSAALPSKS
jgi:hypothetical protein